MTQSIDLEKLLKEAYVTEDLNRTKVLPRHKLVYMIDEINPRYCDAVFEVFEHDWNKGWFASVWRLWRSASKVSDIADEYKELGADPMVEYATKSEKSFRKAIWQIGAIRKDAKKLEMIGDGYAKLIDQLPRLFTEYDPIDSRELYFQAKEAVTPVPKSTTDVLFSLERQVKKVRQVAVSELQNAYERGREYLSLA